MQTSTAPHFDLDAAPLDVRHVTLDVRDLDRAATFYSDTLGLEPHKVSATSVTLGAMHPLLTLRAKPQAKTQRRRDAGLFHIAFLLPLRSDLGDWLRFAAQTDTRIAGAADHNVSEAVYLSDPEGNGIEIYTDRPVTGWRDASGAFHMPSDRLDIGAIPLGAGWTGAPEATRIGHVHLQTTDIPAAETFWTGLGMDITTRYPGGSFFGAGGYHHQIAANVWSSADQPPKDQGTAGLAEITLASRLHPHAQTLTAPSGVAITLDPKGA